MSDKILLVTDPDDSFEQGLRILVAYLEPDQSSLISDCLLSFESMPNIIMYSANELSDNHWMIDKIHKSDLIIFNAGTANQIMVGYLAGKMNSCYFGNLRDLSIVNTAEIIDRHQLKENLERRFEIYGKF